MTFFFNSTYLNSSSLNQISNFLEARGMHVHEKIGEGFQGKIYTLQDRKTGEIAHILKTIDRHLEFNTEKGAHLLANVQHLSLCSPTQFFYRTKIGVITNIPEPESTCLATIMPYIKGRSLMEQMEMISQSTEKIFQFGLMFSNALLELSKHQISHLDLHDENILIKEDLTPVIIDFEGATKTTKVSSTDYQNLHDHLLNMIKCSNDIKLNCQDFLSLCLANKCDPRSLTKESLQALPEHMVSFMQACIDHLSEIKLTSEQPVSKL